MDFEQVITDRYSVRSYSERPVEQAKIDRILAAARLAPTAVNYQPQKIYVLQSEEAMAKVRTLTNATYGAPLAFIIAYDERETWKLGVDHYDAGVTDATIVGTHMMLEAWNIGLGSCWARMFGESKMRKLFDLPDYIHPVALLAVGYPSADSVPYAPWHNVFKDVEEFTEVL